MNIGVFGRYGECLLGQLDSKILRLLHNTPFEVVCSKKVNEIRRGSSVDTKPMSMYFPISSCTSQSVHALPNDGDRARALLLASINLHGTMVTKVNDDFVSLKTRPC
uniref:Uncharacterized protein n=1 Tax=Cacopsylla melanoneura TaxID=428564 RepID=A0A8D8SPI9_9HEMI